MSLNPIVFLLIDKTLTVKNFSKSKSNINIIFITLNIRFVLIEERPQEPSSPTTLKARETYDRWLAANNKVKGYMLTSKLDTI